MTIALSVLFDSAYIEPSLVTVFDAINLGINANVHKVYLVYLKKDEETDREVVTILQAFVDRFSGYIPIVAISVTNSLSELSRHHFNNSIIFKGVMPTIIPDERYILNIDAGTLFGGIFRDFLRKIESAYCESSQSWVVAAHCNPTGDGMPQAFSTCSRNSMYPAGNLLLFNTANYVSHRWLERYLQNYSAVGAYLEYAEQELICLTAGESELLALPDKELRQMDFLSSDVLLGKGPISHVELDKRLIYKVVGTFKPWKYWVLDPNKAIYTRCRSELETEFPLTGNRLIEAARMSCGREEFATGFLRAYDHYVQHLQD